MFREVKLKERAVINEKLVETIKNGSYGVLSTIGEDGFPYGVPLNYTYFEDCICFHCALEGHKIENIEFNEKVSFCVVTKSEIMSRKFDTNYKSTIVFGRAITVEDETEKSNILLSLIKKYSRSYLTAGKNYMKKYWDETRVVKIKINHLSGKANE